MFGTIALLILTITTINYANLGLALYTDRNEEIGVRKALGGSVTSIVALLNKEYVQIVGAAFALGAPLAWLAADWWLGQFAYRIDLSVWPFLAAGIGALVVAVVAVSTQAMRAAQVDPARVLRSE
ncbi:ABC-type antimicrobial peptide transport system permease subunit [Salinibacter ruber]|uniref:ABC transporter permease n=1 Tax=Salinibacter ruber TaxID=146919 RepID=UPI0021670C47|nr:FtsX-like permease family protein [Salinibacter ruber]MCS3651950.1 ABC-type antimicrobial peptide transport system permease subunit [Salinibacter ruber]MCS3655061.1 ABC-type antimicrobial peptide transport system permease subunit [Salinibacter ruber]